MLTQSSGDCGIITIIKANAIINSFFHHILKCSLALDYQLFTMRMKNNSKWAILIWAAINNKRWEIHHCKYYIYRNEFRWKACSKETNIWNAKKSSKWLLKRKKMVWNCWFFILNFYFFAYLYKNGSKNYCFLSLKELWEDY